MRSPFRIETTPPPGSERFARQPAVLAITFEGALLAGQQAVVAVGRTITARSIYQAVIDAQDIEVVETFETDLEEVALLSPDLILDGATEDGVFSGANVEDLRRLAPLVAFPFESDFGWKDYFTFFGDAVGKRQEALAKLDRYDQRVERLREQLGGAEAVSGISVSSIRVRDGAPPTATTSTPSRRVSSTISALPGRRSPRISPWSAFARRALITSSSGSSTLPMRSSSRTWRARFGSSWRRSRTTAFFPWRPTG